jgi:(1->4)-alpha-D-glucan 1-alpha-D-glucosylmutase
VPDIYQGCELWDFSLVDPDNRRPVDYALRTAMLAGFRTHADRAALCAELLACWPDGRIKLYLTWRLLHLRRERAATLSSGSYRALRVDAPDPERVVAFARDDVVVAAPRLVRTRLAPGGIALDPGEGSVMTGLPGRRLRNVLDGRELVTGADGAVALSTIFATLPVAVLTAAELDPGGRLGCPASVSASSSLRRSRPCDRSRWRT